MDNIRPPLNDITLTRNGKLLGHLTTAANNGGGNAMLLLQNANTEWNLAKYGPMGNTAINGHIRFNLCKTIIFAILTYSIKLFLISDSILSKLESCYSKCHRRVLIGPYKQGNESITNLDIRRIFNTPTLKSLLYVRYIKQIYTRGPANFFAYLNSKIEHDGDFRLLGRDIYNVFAILKNIRGAICICNASTTSELRNLF